MTATVSRKLAPRWDASTLRLPPVGAIVSATKGAFSAPDQAEDVLRAATLDKLVLDFDVAEALRRGVLEVRRADRPRLVRTPSGDAAPENRVDTLLEIDVRQIAPSRRLWSAPQFT